MKTVPVTVSAGKESWDIKSRSNYAHGDGKGGINSNWLENFAKDLVSTINESEGEYSAEIDPEDPNSVKIYSPSGVVQNDIALKPDWGANNQISASVRPYARPAMGACPRMANPLNCGD